MFNNSADMAATVNLSCGQNQRYFIYEQEFFATATIDTKPHERGTQRADRSNRSTHRMIAL
jgi:hypothetical protein